MLKGKISSIDELKSFLIDYLKDKNAKVYFFGSRAKGSFNEFSDIDVAIDGNNIDFAFLKFLIEESNLPQKVDIINMNSISEEFKEEILKTGIRWL